MSLKLLPRVALALALTAVALSISGCVAHTEHFGTETDTMVYCSRYEQHRAFEDGMNYLLDNYKVRWYEDYKTFFVDRGYTIVEQSITPYYQIDCYKWSETGELQLKKNDESLCWNYIANVVDVDNNICAFAIISYNYGSEAPGDNINFKPGFTGCALFSVNKIHVSSTDIHEIDDGDVISVSYADHAERIKTILGIDYIIPPENVRLVSVSVREICPLFYIKTENIDGFIPTGNTFVTESAPYISSNTFIPLRDRFISYDEMKKYADLLYEKNGEYVAQRKEFREQYPTGVFTGGPKRVELSKLDFMFDEKYSDLDVPVNNIINCYEYFGLDPTVHYPGAKPWEIVIIVCISATVFSAAFFVAVKNQKKKRFLNK